MAISGGDGSIILTTSVDDSGLSKGLSSLKSGVTAFGKAFATAGAAGVAALTGITKAAVQNYAQYEQLVGGVETLFKGSAQTLINYADQAYKTAGMSANQYMEGITSFSAAMISSVGGDTAKAAELSNQAMIAISDNANKMGTDMESIVMTYQSLAKGNVAMLDNLKLGYGGTKAELERLIEDAEAYKKSMGEIVDYDANNFADITEAIQTIQEKLGIAGATAEEASTTIEGSTLAMKAAWDNLLTGLVDSNADLDDLMDNFSESLVTVFKNVAPAIQKVLENLPDVISDLGSEIIQIIPDTFGDMIPEMIDAALVLIETIATTLSENAYKIGVGLSNAIKTISSSLIELIPTMIAAGKDIILGIVNGMSGSMPVLTTAVMSITAIFATIKVANIVSGIVSGFKGIMSVLNAYQAAVAASASVSTLLASTMTPLQLLVGVLTGKVSLATAAQVAWNAVANANPYILLATAIIGVTAAVAGVSMAYDNYLRQNSEIVIATQKIVDASKEAAEKTKELSDSLDQLGETAESNLMDIEAEAHANETLATELYDLADKTSLTAEEKERMRYIVDELNDSVEDLNLNLDDETGKLNLTEEAVKNLITQKLELAKTNAIQDLYTESLKAQYKAETDAIKNTEALAEAQRQLVEIYQEAETVSVTDVDGQIYSYKQLTREQQLAADNLTEAIDTYKGAINDSRGAMYNAVGDMKSLSEVAGVDLPEGFSEASNRVIGLYNALGLVVEEDFGNAYSYKGQQVGQSFVNGLSGTESDAYTAGFKIIEEAYRGISTGDAKGLGADFAAGYESGILSGLVRVYYAAKSLVNTAKGVIKSTQRSASPAKESMELGDYFGEGYAIGIKGATEEVAEASEELVTVALKYMETSIENAKVLISESLSALVTDTRTEVQKVVDGLNEESLESEKKYERERVRIAKESEEEKWQEKINAADKALKDSLDRAEKQLEKDKKNAKNSEDLTKAQLKYEESITEAHNKHMADIQRIEDDKAKQQRDEVNNNYLKDLNDTAEEERKIYEARKKDIQTNQQNIVKAYQNASDEIIKSIEDLQKRQQALADKLSDYGDIMMEIVEIEDKYANVHPLLNQKQMESGTTYYELGMLSSQTRELESYYETMKNLRDREGMSPELFDIIKNMSFEESFDFAKKLMKKSDTEFNKYIANWQNKQEVSKKITEDLFGDDGEGTLTAQRVLSDITSQTQTIKDYYETLDAVSKRGEIPEEFFSALRDMGVDEGLEYANALLELSDEDFANYIKAWEEKQKTSQLISKQLYKDEAQAIATEVSNKFDEVEQSFFGVGQNSADMFESGFLEELGNVVANIKKTIGGALLGTLPFDVNYNGISINIPALAKGTVLPGGKPFLAMVNDQPRGQTNIEAPLDTIVDAMNISLQNNPNVNRGGNTEVILQIDGREFGRAVVEQGNRENRRIGTRLVIA